MTREEIGAVFIILYFFLSIMSGIIWMKEMKEDKWATFVVATGFSCIALPLYFIMRHDDNKRRKDKEEE